MRRGGTAPECFDVKYLVIVDRKNAESRSALANDVMSCMKEVQHFIDHPKDLVSIRIIETWIPEHFRTKLLIDGKHVYNPSSRVKCPHKSDACADCERLKSDSSSLEQSLKRHCSQNDHDTITRREAISTLTKEISDLKQNLQEHLDEAKEPSDYHKDLNKHANDDFMKLEAEWMPTSCHGKSQ